MYYWINLLIILPNIFYTIYNTLCFIIDKNKVSIVLSIQTKLYLIGLE